ncbi:unnamed protein product [Prorocentrum cordatum]|uniref:type I protein arginine methyltransferase n=1 Tax=Prorocentrum cordatum TaxID=2364126 RepID=A0ABN9X7C8_9DINO|nr:unnamed protein product [Polarella glacialis]
MMKNQEGMLRDDARVEGYRAALEAAAPQLRGATVMCPSIGTGSGLLAFLAAKYGARRVYAVEASPQMARVASRLARANGFVGVVQVLPKQVEDITEEEVATGSVDVIVSELFSHFSGLGLQAVTEAKRRFLRPGGLVLPAMSRLFLSPFEDRALGAELRARHSFWQERDFRGLGLDLSAAWPLAEEQALKQNVMDVVPPEALLVPPGESPWAELDLAGPTTPTTGARSASTSRSRAAARTRSWTASAAGGM